MFDIKSFILSFLCPQSLKERYFFIYGSSFGSMLWNLLQKFITKTGFFFWIYRNLFLFCCLIDVVKKLLEYFWYYYNPEEKSTCQYWDTTGKIDDSKNSSKRKSVQLNLKWFSKKIFVDGYNKKKIKVFFLKIGLHDHKYWSNRWNSDSKKLKVEELNFAKK